ncbi:hypothetical protein ACFQ5J_09355 [Lacticaseibacillus baoqingensis]|uniref:Membrane-binding protein n=1 Tax=Lacticaseibacillus baoqingensis TaxID=2486013 RepID=A0ABW4E6A5_9LACO|nr:hypothetical protein [Lacticaseibacillus baoqingensis]
MRYSRLRALAELVTVLLIVSAAWFALRPATAHSAHYTLDKAAITYDGQVLKGKFSGPGTLTFKNGDHYRGTFKAGRFNGRGTYTSHHGWQYQGQFKAGVMQGQGTLTTAHKTYKGTFNNGVFNHTSVEKD